MGVACQSHHQRLNLLGFWRAAGVEAAHLIHRLIPGHLKSTPVKSTPVKSTPAKSTPAKSTPVIRAVEEQLLPFLARPTVLLLDNATLHRSAHIKEKLQAWKAAGLHIWFLPPYCPHLNLIEVQLDRSAVETVQVSMAPTR